MNLHYVVIALAIVLTVITFIKSNPYTLPSAVLLLAAEAFSHVSK